VADFVFNTSKGRVRGLLIDGAKDLIVVILKTAEADATLKDYTTLSALLAAGGGANNVEANFTNYARKTVTNANAVQTVDNVNERVDIDIPDQAWAAAGGAANNTTVKVIVCTDGANDAARIPLTSHDFAVTTDGSDVTAQIAAAGFYRAQ
jgi:hypothetical protein